MRKVLSVVIALALVAFVVPVSKIHAEDLSLSTVSTYIGIPIFTLSNNLFTATGSSGGNDQYKYYDGDGVLLQGLQDNITINGVSISSLQAQGYSISVNATATNQIRITKGDDAYQPSPYLNSLSSVTIALTANYTGNNTNTLFPFSRTWTPPLLNLDSASAFNNIPIFTLSGNLFNASGSADGDSVYKNYDGDSTVLFALQHNVKINGVPVSILQERGEDISVNSTAANQIRITKGNDVYASSPYLTSLSVATIEVSYPSGGNTTSVVSPFSITWTPTMTGSRAWSTGSYDATAIGLGMVKFSMWGRMCNADVTFDGNSVSMTSINGSGTYKGMSKSDGIVGLYFDGSPVNINNLTLNVDMPAIATNAVYYDILILPSKFSGSSQATDPSTWSMTDNKALWFRFSPYNGLAVYNGCPSSGNKIAEATATWYGGFGSGASTNLIFSVKKVSGTYKAYIGTNSNPNMYELGAGYQGNPDTWSTSSFDSAVKAMFSDGQDAYLMIAPNCAGYNSTSPALSFTLNSINGTNFSNGYVNTSSSNNPTDAKTLGNLPSASGATIQTLNQTSVSYNNSLANDSEIQQGYILDEPFMCWPIENGGLLLSGWDVNNAGGGLQDSPYECFRMIDTNSSEPVSISRRFVEQQNGTVVIDFYTGVSTTSLNGSTLQFKNDNTTVLQFAFDNGYLRFSTDAAGAVNLMSYSPLAGYGVRIVADFASQKASVWVDGIQRAANISFSANSIDNVYVATSTPGTGVMYLNYLGMYKGYTVMEKFITSLSGYLPNDWKKSGTQTAAIVENSSDIKPDIYSLRLLDSNTSDFVNVYKPFDQTKAKTAFEYKFIAQSSNDSCQFKILHDAVADLSILVEDGNIYYINGKGTKTDIYDYVPGMWYSVEVQTDPYLDTATILINEKTALAGVRMYASLYGFNGISFSTLKEKQTDMLLDDIKVTPILSKPSDYVPEPNAVSTGNYIVGVQSCDIYRGTDHLGWDRLNGFENNSRKPLIGWYDDGNPEAMDWQLKYMAEHGITFWMPLWMRSYGTSGNPIKTPMHGFALHDGYFNAEYSDTVKFAINFGNDQGSIQNAADFRNNIIPYWIEYYFKDSRYMIIDNKPVVCFLSYEDLKAKLGGTASAVKTELDYLRAQCQAIGFSGAYILIDYNNNSTVSEVVSAGFDYFTTYTWGQMYSDSSSGQSCALKDIQAISGAPFISTLGAGFDSYAYDLVNVGGLMSTNDYRNLAGYAKNNYMTQFSSGSLMSRMAILDNWNEFGEGHFITPAEGNNFGFLDAIREVFVGTSSHTDAIPTKTQKDRIGVLYPQDRILSPASRYPIMPTVAQCTNVVKRWNFNTNGNTEGFYGFTYDGWCGSVTASGGCLNVSNGSRSISRIYSTINANADASDISYIRIRILGNTSAFDGDFLYIMDNWADVDWRYGGRSMKVETVGSNYTDYIVDVGRGNKWEGTFNKMQIWFYTGGQTINIDFIEAIGTP